MPNLLKPVPLFLLFSIMVALGNSSGPAAVLKSKTASENPILQTRGPQDLSNKYQGRVYFGDMTGDKYVMRGISILEIKNGGKDFTLTQIQLVQGKKVVKELSGRINTEVIGNNIRAGLIQFAGDNQQISIRWEIGPRGSLKIVRQIGFPRVFRFCTEDIVKKGHCAADL